MSYVDRSLIPGETVQARARLHWYLYFWTFVVMAAGLAGVIVFRDKWLLATPFALVAIYGGAYWLHALIVGWTTELAVTNFRVIAKKGLVARETVEQILNRVDSIEVSQSLAGRMLDYGSIMITGTGVTHTPFAMIADPLGFRRAVHMAIEKHPTMPGQSLPQAKGV